LNNVRFSLNLISKLIIMGFFKKLFGIKDKEGQGVLPKPYIDEKKKHSTSIEEVMEQSNTEITYVPETTYVKTSTAAKTVIQQKNTAVKKDPHDPRNWVICKKGGKEGFEDEDGHIMIEPRFDKVSYFEGGVAGIKMGEKHGAINAKGEYVLPPVYDYVFNVQEGLICFEEKEKYGFASPDGTIKISAQYDYAGGFCEGMCAVTNEEGYTYYINKENQKAIDMLYEDAGDFSDGLAYATPYDMPDGKNKTGFIDKTGAFVIKPQFDCTGDFREGLAPVEINGKYGFINKQGKLICDLMYADAEEFFQGRAAVRMEENGPWGFADTAGKIVIPCQFDYSAEFDEDGTAYVFIKGKCYTLYTDGRKEAV
jgi:hypothetical protein